jgi:hypothetical protein
MKILILALCSYLYRLGGSDKAHSWPYGVDKKGARVVGIPAVMALSLAIFNKNLFYLFNALTMQSLRLGDGIPDATDPGSFLGRIFKKDWLTSGVVQGINALATYSIKYFINHDLQSLVVFVLINSFTAGILKYAKAKDKYIEPARGAALSLVLFM